MIVLELYCEECGTRLPTKATADERRPFEIKVIAEPCPVCLHNEWLRGREEVVKEMKQPSPF